MDTVMENGVETQLFRASRRLDEAPSPSDFAEPFEARVPFLVAATSDCDPASRVMVRSGSISRWLPLWFSVHPSLILCADPNASTSRPEIESAGPGGMASGIVGVILVTMAGSLGAVPTSRLAVERRQGWLRNPPPSESHRDRIHSSRDPA